MNSATIAFVVPVQGVEVWQQRAGTAGTPRSQAAEPWWRRIRFGQSSIAASDPQLASRPATRVADLDIPCQALTLTRQRCSIPDQRKPMLPCLKTLRFRRYTKRTAA